MMQLREQAVSPVVGVMLMLVVTIIIAAIVSAFAGSTVGATSKTPTATIQATFSQANGMIISHGGGDAIPLGTTTILTKPTKVFGVNATRYAWVVNKTYVLTGTGQSWATTRAFLPGDTATISAFNLSFVQQRPDMWENDFNDPNLGFNVSTNVGYSFELQFVDSGGNTIGKTTVIISR
jgi:FlaG/FlaF family flagellin (archaellin)